EITTKEKDALVRKLPAEVFPEYFLIRVNEFNKVAVTPLEEWIEYLKTGCIRHDTTAPGLGEARKKLIYYNMSPEERHAYDEHLSAIMIQNDVLDGAKLEGRMEGMEKGIEKGRMDIARNLKSMGLDIAAIQKATGLLPEEIQKL
ncbi:hypothetical protein F2Z41_23850, partial [Bacteroides faecis]